MKQNIYLNKTKRTPKVQLELDKKVLNISGRSISENIELVYIPILKSINETKMDNFNIVIDLEYLNCRSTKYIFEILKKSSNNFETYVEWICESCDSDLIDIIDDISNLLNLKINLTIN
jgi:hypothetical protein